MRIQEFSSWAVDVFGKAPHIEHVTGWEEGTTRPHGLEVTFTGGGRLWLALTMQTPPGTDASVPAEPVTGPAPDPVTFPDLPTGGGGLPVSAAAQYLAAVVAESGNTEIAKAYPYDAKGSSVGFGVVFHNGFKVFCPVVRTARAGQQPGRAWDLQKEI